VALAAAIPQSQDRSQGGTKRENIKLGDYFGAFGGIQMGYEAVPYQERLNWLDPRTSVTDDPRRVPMPPRDRAGDRPIVLKGGRIFTGTGAPVFTGTVVVDKGRIAHVLPDGMTDWPSDAIVYDLAGQTIMPGLIDCHIHMCYTEPGLSMAIAQSRADATLRSIERLRYYVESGVTCVRDAGSADDIPFRIKAWVRDNRLPLPRILACGCLITGTGGHGAEGLSSVSAGVGSIREASGPDDWRNAAREQFKKGADVIKIASHYSREELAAIVDEAHTLGLKVMCDAEAFYVQWAAEGGVDSIEHPLPRTDEAIRIMAERGVAAVPTLVPYTLIIDVFGGYFGSTSRRFTFTKESNLALLRKMREAGVKCGIGTDIVMENFRYLPAALLRELKLFAEAGYSTTEVLEAATRVGAEILDMAHLIGTLEEGKLADILVVNGRPDENLDDLVNVNLVLRDGDVIVEDGRVYIERHKGWDLPEPSDKPKGPWF